MGAVWATDGIVIYRRVVTNQTLKIPIVWSDSRLPWSPIPAPAIASLDVEPSCRRLRGGWASILATRGQPARSPPRPSADCSVIALKLSAPVVVTPRQTGTNLPLFGPMLCQNAECPTPVPPVSHPGGDTFPLEKKGLSGVRVQYLKVSRLS